MSAPPVCDLCTPINVSALQQLRWLDLMGNRLTGTLSSAVCVACCVLQASCFTVARRCILAIACCAVASCVLYIGRYSCCTLHADLHVPR